MSDLNRNHFWQTPEQERAALGPKPPWILDEPKQFSFCPKCVKGGGKVLLLDAAALPNGDFRRDGWSCPDHGFMTHAEIANYRSDLSQD